MIQLLQNAVAKRARLLTPETNAVRLLDGGGGGKGGAGAAGALVLHWGHQA